MKEQQEAESKTKDLAERMKNIFSTKEFIYALSTGLICTFTSLGITSCIEDKNREINLRPYLEIGPSKISYRDGYFGLVIRNTGKGAAIIDGGYIKVNNKSYDIKDVDHNIWDTLFPELKIYSKILNDIFDEADKAEAKSVKDDNDKIYIEFKNKLEEKEINKNNSCKLFFSLDYVPTLKASIKDGEDLALIGFPTQYVNSNIAKDIKDQEEKKSGNEIFKNIYDECRGSFNDMIKRGDFNIKLLYSSLNGNRYELEETVRF